MFLVIMITCYFIPSVVAAAMRHRQTPAIFAVNLFLGWTFIGWIGALVWALIREPAGAPQSYR